MKKTLIIASLALFALPAFASKARLAALANSAHLSDIQEVFSNPSKLTESGDWLTFEMGATSSNASGDQTTLISPNAEGGFARGAGDARYGFYLGHHATWVADTRVPNSLVTGTAYLTDENPVDLFYATKMGDMSWGVGLHHSSSDRKSNARKQTATGLTAGVTANNWDAGIEVGLTNTYKLDGATDTIDFKGKTAIALNGTYTMDTLTFHGSYAMGGGKADVTGTATPATDIDSSRYILGVVNSHKADGADFFYGTNYDMLTYKNKAGTEAKYTHTRMPVFAGIEADAASWLVLRASISQNFLIGSTKNELAGATESDTIGNNTTVVAGAGLKFNKLILDGTIEQSTGSANIDSDDLLANASLTYMF